jgi:DNA-binding transcriptional regulator YiaG
LKKTESDLYFALEKMFYDYNFSMNELIKYVVSQEKDNRERIYLFFEWFDYLEKIERKSSFEKMPKNFYYEYNTVLELNGENPIIYDPEWEDYGVGLFERHLNEIIFKGRFPCDKSGNPVLKWIGIEIRDAGSIKCEVDQYSKGQLIIELTPKTYIAANDPYRDQKKNAVMDIVYIGPQLMSFKFEVLKRYREQCHYTQQQVAGMIGTALRTYQKWESGETTPDGHNLLRLMNVFDIDDLGEITKTSN